MEPEEELVTPEIVNIARDIPRGPRRGAISAEVYQDEEIKNFSRKVRKCYSVAVFYLDFRLFLKITKQCRHYKEFSKILNY